MRLVADQASCEPLDILLTGDFVHCIYTYCIVFVFAPIFQLFRSYVLYLALHG